MNVLLIYTNINGFHIDTYSVGLASIVSITKKAGHNAKVLIIKDKTDYPKILETVSSFNPGVVGFTSVSSQFGFVKEISTSIKNKYPNIITVCGGVHPTINSDCLKECESLDGLFIGEADMSFVEFLEKIEHRESYRDTDNFAYMEEGRFISNRLKPLISDLDKLPFPDREIYPFVENLKLVGYSHFFFSRGCPYLCSYCSNHAIARNYNLVRNYTRYRSVESSIREIEETMRKFPIKKVLIGDDIFGINKEWREEFCKEYRKRIKIKFLCLLRANIIDETFIKLLKEAGCYRIQIGIESGNEWVRNTIMNRGMSDHQIIDAFDIAHKYGLQTNAINIIGVPGETEEMIWDTIRLNRRCKPNSSGVNIFYPYKGTVLGDYCFKNSLVDETSYRTFSNERRESVLNYPEWHKKKLIYYAQNWGILVAPLNLKLYLIKFFQEYIQKTFIYRWLRAFKHFIQQRED